MAHKKAGGSTQLGRDSQSKRLGVKTFGSERVSAGEVLIRQRGNKYLPGLNVGQGGDDTLFALISGIVKFTKTVKTRFDGSRKSRTTINVVTAE